MTIIRARMEHLPWVRHLYQQLVAEQQEDFDVHYPTYDRTDYDDFILGLAQRIADPMFCLVVAIVRRKVVGFMCGGIEARSFGAPRRYATVYWLYVEPKHRKSGVARAMLLHGLTFCVEQGVQHVEFFGVAGDTSWERRGATPILTKYHGTVEGFTRIGAAQEGDVDPPEAVDALIRVNGIPIGEGGEHGASRTE